MVPYKAHFFSLCDNSGVPNKMFWDSVKPFMNDKGSLCNENYVLLENGVLIRDDRKISEIFKDHYVDTVENSTGNKLEGPHFISLNNQEQIEKKEILDNILEKCSQHPSIINIETNLPHDKDVFQFLKA